MSGVDVLHARVSFRDRAFIDVLDLALRFVAVHGRLVGTIALIVLVPCVASTLAIAAAWGWLAGWLAAIALSFVAQIPFTVLASRLVFQEEIGVFEVLRLAARELPRVLVVRVLWSALLLASATLMLVPAVYVGAAFFFVTEVMVLERSRIVPSFGRARRVVAHAFPDALAGAFVAVLVPLIAVLVAEVGGRALITELFQFRPPPSAIQQGGGSALAVIGWFSVVPYLATARFFEFLNVRTRVEGWDIQTRFAALAAREAEP